MLKAAARRLPGIRFFEPRPAPLEEVLPRMDVAAFVGLAASGPLHMPVAIEDAAQFAAVFGEAAPLAWDAASGATVQARLAPAVQAFFANGGRRCWVVRVAGDDAADNYFPLPGIAVLRPSSERRLFPAFARARSRGSWSDGFMVGADIELRPLQAQAGYDGAGPLILSTDSRRPAKGDLLRCVFSGGRYEMFAAVTQTAQSPESPPPAAGVAVGLSRHAWFERIGASSPPPGESFTRARLYDTLVHIPDQPGSLSPSGTGTAHPFERETQASLRFEKLHAAAEEVHAVLDLDLPPREAPRPGALVGLDWEGEAAWLVVESVQFVEAAQSPLQTAVRARGAVWRPLAGRPAGPLDSPLVAVVGLDVRVQQQGERSPSTLRDLGFAPHHPRYWNSLEPDEAFFSRSREVVRTLPFPLAGAEGPEPPPPQDRQGPDDPKALEPLFVPLGLASRLDAMLPALGQTRAPLERDGLSRFGDALFLDPELADTGTEQLMAQADSIRYLRPAARPLKGIHSLLGLEEVTLVAVPDAAQRAWKTCEPAAAPEVLEPDLPPAQDGARFKDCDIRSVSPPELVAPGASDEDGTFTLGWFSQERGHYVLQEATQPGFGDARVLYEGEARQITLYGRSPGHYFYRASVRVGRNTSGWSGAVALRVGADTRWQSEPLADYRDDTLVAVHRALLRMCAGSAELLAVLSLPLHYREDQAVAHAARLHAIDGFESRALGYGALYHPWVLQRRADGRLDEVPPDGVACGVLALRAAQRGAWIAPANEPLQGVLALAPGAAPAHWQALQQAQINVLRQHPRGFLALAEDTLSADPDLRPINVRRLLVLLRRLALRRGAMYVFEPLNAAFRRMVERGFEEALAGLFRRGAFAGATPAAAYQVSAGPDVNSPQSLDQGRFVIELKVAPSVPMAFISVRLVHGDERLAVVEGR